MNDPTVRISPGDSARRGIAVIIVLSVIAITMSVSYALLRTQATTAQVQANADLRALARQSAQAGYNIALQKMHANAWAGADTSTTGNVSTNQSYTVTFTTGDSSLTSGSPNYGEFPYRITLLATGTATDPNNPAVSVSCQIRAVLKLVPRLLRSEPTNWTTMNQYTVYQTNSDDVVLEPCCRIEGPVRLQGKVRLYENAPADSTCRTTYESALLALHTAGQPDNRPLNGAVNLPFARTDSSTRTELTTDLGLTLVDISETSVSGDWVFPTTTTYKLYTGGKQYTMTTVSGTLQNTSLSTNPLTNPAGLFYCSGDLTLGNNVVINGTLLCNGNLTINGSGLSLTASTLKSLQGTSTPVQLPVLAVNGNLTFGSSATGAINGLVACFKEFKLNSRPQTTTLAINGRLVAKQLTLLAPTDWTALSSVGWQSLYLLYGVQKALPVGYSNFANYLASVGLPSTVTVTIKPAATTANYHWQRSGNPIFIKHTNDPGLRWDVVEMKELQ